MRTLDEVKKQIVTNLRTYHSGKWVNQAVAVVTITEDSALIALRELVEQRVIEQKLLHYNGHQMPMVRYVEHDIVPTLTVIPGGKNNE